MEPLRFELDLAATRDRVWDLFTTEAGVTSWLCLRARIVARVGGVYELFWNPDASRPDSDSTIGCTILSIDRPRLVSFTWRGADAVADVMNADGTPPTEVTVELRPRPTGTRLRMVHTGWGSGAEWEKARAWFDRAWRGALAQLAKVVSEGGG